MPKKERELLNKYDFTKESIWDVVGEKDDWYNLGGPYKVQATSELKSQSGVTYFAKKAHDFSFKTVWAEGKNGYGIGEALIYYFKPLSPRITKIIIYNGYLKNPELWRANSRVKKLLMYKNNRPFAILELMDSMAKQTFTVDPLRSNVRDQDLVLSFKILEVYHGEKYDDTVITELYFDGIDVL